MAHRPITGQLTGDIVDVRFPFSGLVSKVFKYPGEQVKQGDWLASLDKKELQADLDRQLADYEKIRAEFEIFNLHNPNVGTDLLKYEKIQKQAALNSSVKSVESAKYKMDAADLKSPVAGIVCDISNLRPGLFVTPGSYSVSILDTSSLVFSAEITWLDLTRFSEGSVHKIKFESLKEEIEGTTLPLIPSQKGLTIRLSLPTASTLPLGLSGTIQ